MGRGAAHSANSKSQVGSLGVLGFFVFLLLSPCSTRQVQGVSGTLRNADKRSSSSLEEEDWVSGLSEVPAVGTRYTKAQPCEEDECELL